MDDLQITLPRSEETALLKQEQYTTDNDSLRETMGKLLEPEDEFTQRVRELVIGSQAKREDEDDGQPDEDGVVDILGYELDSELLEQMLRNLKELHTFTWCVDMPIPQNILDVLHEVYPNVQVRTLKIQKTDEANVIPELDFTSYDSFLSRQYFDRNDFGSMVYSHKQDDRSLRLHLLVPYYPVDRGDEKIEWLRRKTAVAISAIESIENLSSFYATDYQGELALLVPALVKHASTLQMLGLHTIPGSAYSRPKGPSCLGADEIGLLASNMKSLTRLEIDFKAFETEAESMKIPFTSGNAAVLALATFTSLRRLRLWIEVSVKASIFQDTSEGSGSSVAGGLFRSPPLKEDKLVQAVGNLYALLRSVNSSLELEWLEVAFTRLDSWDRQDSYPRFLPVRLRPSHHSVEENLPKNGEDGHGADGFTIEVGAWQDDHPEEDVGKFMDYAVGHIY
ncbi:hypothetical protein PV04_01958 [Phialophora macrospora]|uniref:Uncharacterized protein n=1 Tax=Phialophora macrospora TaxID=1851006 RepID=A0A0D2G502_9EURO|nr:hypothetical protein PV04_01958 [Phialophora macrospora]